MVNLMTRYYIEMDVTFSGYIEAHSKENAEEMAQVLWGTHGRYPIQYKSVSEIFVTEEEEGEEL